MAKVVFSGPANSGKTSLVEQLIPKTGWALITESANEVKKPGLSMDKICEAIGTVDVLKESQLHPEGKYILDRCYIDNEIYSDYHQSEKLYPDFDPSYDLIFVNQLLPRAFYENKGTRDESYEDMKKMEAFFMKGFQKRGYDPIFVPFLGMPSDRVDFVIEHMKKHKLL